MLRFYYIISFLCTYSFVYAQQNYFQQEVNYKIDVTLNDVSHELSAFEKIEYINKSNTSLEFIYFNLWPNAYKNNETALAKHMLESGETAMYFAKPEDLGYIDSLNFLINGKAIIDGDFMPPDKIRDSGHEEFVKKIMSMPST